MGAIVPRWEWRTFGSRFGAAEEVFAGLTPSEPKESDELYLLSTAPEANGGVPDTIKVRDALMDIKVLREVDGDGLERWEPVLKTPFPLSRAHVTRVFEGLGAVTPPLERDAYPLDRFLRELVVSGGGIRAVPVHKRRVRYEIDGCAAELSDVTVEGRTIRTLAIESPDAAAVIGAVRRIGLGDLWNTSYPRGLRAVLADTPRRFAVIDVGTNSVKFHVAERTADGAWQPVVDRAEVSRLGEGVGTDGSISDAARDRTVSAIAGMVREARDLGAVGLAAVGTAGLRMARNAVEVLDAIREDAGVRVEVISGEDEGRLAYLAAIAGLGVTSGSVVAVDTGGGSSQFTFGHGGQVEERFSLNVGAVRYTERFGLAGPVASSVVEAAEAAIADDLERIAGRATPDVLIGMGGGITNITAVKHGLATYDPDVVQGSVLDIADIDAQIERYRALDADGRRGIVGLQPKRAEVILAGACIVRTVMSILGATSLRVSDRGLRHGVLVERFADID